MNSFPHISHLNDLMITLTLAKTAWLWILLSWSSTSKQTWPLGSLLCSCIFASISISFRHVLSVLAVVCGFHRPKPSPNKYYLVRSLSLPSTSQCNICLGLICVETHTWWMSGEKRLTCWRDWGISGEIIVNYSGAFAFCAVRHHGYLHGVVVSG